MNVDTLISWGQKTLAFLDRQQVEASPPFDPEQVQAKVGWLNDFRQQIEDWSELLQGITTAESFVRQQGLHRQSHLELKDLRHPLAHSEQAKKVCSELLTFVAEQGAKAKPNERLLGSSEVIESLLGKLKRLEQDQAKNGFTGLLLSLGAMVSTTTNEVIQAALETVPTKKVLAWGKENLGLSVQAKRRRAFAFQYDAEQKWNQLCQVV